MNTLTTFFALAKNDFLQQKRRFGVAAVLFLVTALSLLFAIAFGAVATSIWLSETYGIVFSLFFVSAFFVTLSAALVITNFFYQRKQKRTLAQSSALKGAAVANLLVATRNSKAPTVAILAVIGFALANQIYRQSGDH